MTGGPIDRRLLLAFAAVVLIAGSNIVAVRFSNRELDPFWGAGIRFLLGSLILWAFVVLGRHALPEGRALRGTLLYGVLAFFVSYAFFYWGSQEVPAGLGGTIIGAVPLLSVLLAVAQRMQPLRAHEVVGALIALGGIALMSSGGPLRGGIDRLGARGRNGGDRGLGGRDRAGGTPDGASRRHERGRDVARGEPAPAPLARDR